MNNNFRLYSSYYDLLYSDKDYSKEAAYVTGLIRAMNSDAVSILEYGCGTGNHARYMCEEQFNVTGLERSAEMVVLAKEKNINGFDPQCADITSFALNKKFDIVTALFHVISYLAENTALVNCFRCTNKHLDIGGHFIFDTWYGPAVYAQKPETRIKRLQNNEIEVVRLAEPVWHYERNTIDVNYEIFVTTKQEKITERFNETHPMRYFTIPEMELLAAHTGFELVKAEEFSTGNAPGTATWGVCFILKKINDVE